MKAERETHAIEVGLEDRSTRHLVLVPRHGGDGGNHWISCFTWGGKLIQYRAGQTWVCSCSYGNIKVEKGSIMEIHNIRRHSVTMDFSHDIQKDLT